MKIVIINKAKNPTSTAIKDAMKISSTANNLLDACGCTGNGNC